MSRAMLLLVVLAFHVLGTSAATDCGQKPADILFIVDESGSVGPDNFKTTLQFVQNVIRELDIGPFDVQVAMLAFSDNVRSLFDFNTFSTKQDVLDEVASTAYSGGGTNTHIALQYAGQTSFTSGNGMRSNAAQIAFVITDGRSGSSSATKTEAAMLREKGVTVISVGVGDGINFGELNDIATDPDSSHVFLVNDYDSLDVILGTLRQAACVAEAAVLCDVEADIVFLLDVSHIFSEQQLDGMRQLVTGVADKFILGPQYVQIGVDTFSTEFNRTFFLKDYPDKAGLESALSSISFTYGDTNTGNALRAMREGSFTAGAGHRENVAKIAILVTNGYSGNATLTSLEAQEIQEAGITLLVVGVGQDLSVEELETIATDPGVQNVYRAAAFDVLSTLEGEIAASVCGQLIEPSGDISPAQVQGRQADIVFIMDSSRSVQYFNFKLLLEFINTVVKDLEVRQQSIRIGIQTFNSRPNSQVNLNRFDDKTALMEAIEAIEYREGGSDIAAAIIHMDEVMFQAANGDRPGVPNIGIFMTDGRSSDPERTRMAAQRARDGGITIFTVGIGEGTSRSELDDMASDPDSAHVLTVTEFAKLNAVKLPFMTQLFQAIPAVLPPYVPPANTGLDPGPDPCRDQIPNCAEYDQSVCISYEEWALKTCARTCEFCTPTNQTVAPPCADNLPDCSDYGVNSCGSNNRAWAMENCRESCGYCSPGTQTGGFFNKCSYKGVQYSQGDKWDDGCSYECECTDASTGRYQCYNKCPSYYNIPDECTLVQIYGQCCLEPYCDFQHNFTTKNVSELCTFNSRNYKEGEVWSVGCQFECICVSAARGLYTCQDKCPQYGELPSNCEKIKTPGECCERPVCEFQTQVGVFTGGGGPSGPGVNRMNEKMTQCEDNIPDCERYQPDLCNSQTNASFALENCRQFCNLCNENVDLTSLPSDVCVYNGETYKQGEAWYDGCDRTCVCENAAFGYYRCDDRCPEFLDLPEGCLMVSVPGQCCRSLYCDTPVTLFDSQTTSGTVGAIPPVYQAPPDGQYPTLPPGQTYAPGQNPDPVFPPGNSQGSEEVPAAVIEQPSDLRFGTGCSPVREGQPTTITCDVDTATCPNLFTVKWKADTQDISTCTEKSCGNFHSISGLNVSTSISQTMSTLTVSHVTRTSMETKWTCSPCGAMEVTVCSRLEVYASPENPECTVSEDIVAGEIQSVTISCSTDRVYPAAQCSFERTKDGSSPVPITTAPTYNHKPTGESPVYYRSECSVSVPVEDLEEGTHSFQGYIYPDVREGKSLVGASAPAKTLTIGSDSRSAGPRPDCGLRLAVLAGLAALTLNVGLTR